MREKAAKRGFPEASAVVRVVLRICHEEEEETEKEDAMQLILVFEILLLVAIVAGIFIGWEQGEGRNTTLDRN